MPDLDELAGLIGEQLAALVQPMFTRLEAEFAQRLDAVAVRGADITPAGELVLAFGDGSTRNLGRVVGVDGHDGLDGAPGADVPADALDWLTERLEKIEGTFVRDALIDVSGAMILQFGDGETRTLGRVVGQDGHDGRDGVDVSPEVLNALTARVSACEGQSVRGALIDRSGELVLTLADGTSHAVGAVVGRDGVDGHDGQPGPAGLGFEDLDVNLDADGRTLVISFVRGDLAQTFEIEVPAMVYRGPFAADGEYRRGDVVSFGGSAWVCSLTPTSTRPGEGDGWTLAVKRGRDGKDFAGPVHSKAKAVA